MQSAAAGGHRDARRGRRPLHNDEELPEQPARLRAAGRVRRRGDQAPAALRADTGRAPPGRPPDGTGARGGPSRNIPSSTSTRTSRRGGRPRPTTSSGRGPPGVGPRRGTRRTSTRRSERATARRPTASRRSGPTASRRAMASDLGALRRRLVLRRRRNDGNIILLGPAESRGPDRPRPLPQGTKWPIMTRPTLY